MGLALLLNRSSIIGKIFEKVLILLPLMIAPVIAGVIWKRCSTRSSAILNHILGLGNTFDWLSGNGTVLGGPRQPMDLRAVRGDPDASPASGRCPKSRSRPPGRISASWFYMFRKLMLPMLWPYILVIGHLPVHGQPQGHRSHLRAHRRAAPVWRPGRSQIGAFEDSIINLDYSRGSTYMLLLWIIHVHHRALPGQRARQGSSVALRERSPNPWHSRYLASELLPGQKRLSPGSVVADAGLIGWFLFSLFPIAWMVILTLKNAEETDHLPSSSSPAA